MSTTLLLLTYRLYVERTGLRNGFVEGYLASRSPQAVPFNILEDDRRNLPELYKAAFASTRPLQFECLYNDAMEKLRLLPYDQSGEILDGLMFLQHVVATALWKYRCNVGQTLESFARDFDRLDSPVERQRLHQLAQSR